MISTVGSLSLAQLRLAGATQATAIHSEEEFQVGGAAGGSNRAITSGATPTC